MEIHTFYDEGEILGQGRVARYVPITPHPNVFKGEGLHASAASQMEEPPNYFGQVWPCTTKAVNLSSEGAIVLSGLKQKLGEHFADFVYQVQESVHC